MSNHRHLSAEYIIIKKENQVWHSWDLKQQRIKVVSSIHQSMHKRSGRALELDASLQERILRVMNKNKIQPGISPRDFRLAQLAAEKAAAQQRVRQYEQRLPKAIGWSDF